jgi:hypothetical protein
MKRSLVLFLALMLLLVGMSAWGYVSVETRSMKAESQTRGCTVFSGPIGKSSKQAERPAWPDICRTPSPGSPVPIPYPNVATSRERWDRGRR